VKAIIFDIDGTLIESMSVDSELYFSSIREVLGPVKIRNLSDYDNVTDSGILAQILDDNGHSVSVETITSVKSVFIEELRRHVKNVGSFPIIDGAVQFVESVRKSNECRVAVATGGWRESALLKLESAGFNIDGSTVATSDDSPSRVVIMQLALKMVGDDVGSVTYFGDAEWDRRACHALGWNFVAVGKELDGIESYKDIEL
jgi:beta-phosphoglucomutase-like phosphatase (HAD superfamily)